MTTIFRAVLILGSGIALATVVRRIRRARMRIEDAVFWVLLMMVFMLFAVFPAAADACARLLGIYSTPNFIFLFVIFILLIKSFSLSLEISSLEDRVRQLAENTALERYQARERDQAKEEQCGRETEQEEQK